MTVAEIMHAILKLRPEEREEIQVCLTEQGTASGANCAFCFRSSAPFYL